jgi:hypothetical protein
MKIVLLTAAFMLLIAGASLAILIQEAHEFGRAFHCNFELQRSVSSPDGSKVATSLLMGCGATVGFATKVCLISPEAAQSFEHCDPILFVDGKHEPVQGWLSNRTLVLELPPGEKVFEKVNERDGVTIQYVSVH